MPKDNEHLLEPPDGDNKPKNESDDSQQHTDIPTGSDNSETAHQRGPSATDTGVSWIYKLRKEELTQELQKFRLDTTGTVEEKRKRLVTFMRVGHASPQPLRTPTPFVFPPQPPTEIPNITAPVSTTVDPLSIRKWNIYFNGKGDPAAFIERLDEICTYSNFDQNQLLSVLPELLQGTPLLWYRNNKRFWRSWTDFLRDFRTLYFPVNYLEDLEAEIGRRLQQTDESVIAYLTDLQTLIRRHGGMTSEQELRWLYRNLLPDYRQYIKKTDFTDVPTLTAKVKEFEVLRKEVQMMYPIPLNRAVTATKLPDRDHMNSSYVNTGARPMQAPRLAAPGTQARPQRPPWERQRPPQPSTSRQTAGAGNQISRPINRPTVSSNNICWRCGETGHYRSQCRSVPKLFCSRCGREGTMTRDCDCQKSEN